MIFSSPPQFGQCSKSSLNTRLSSLAQLSVSVLTLSPENVLLTEITAELAAMGDATQDVLSKRVAGLRSSRRYGKYLKLGDKGLELDSKAVKAAEHCDGKFIVHGNDNTLSAEDMALGYKQLMRVEQAWAAT